MVEAGVLPSGEVLLSSPSKRYYYPLRLPLTTTHFGFPYRVALSASRISQVGVIAFSTFRSPYAGGFASSNPDFRMRFSPSPYDTRLGLLFSLSADTSRRGRIHFMLRTVKLFPFFFKGLWSRFGQGLSTLPRRLTSGPSGGYPVRTWLISNRTCWLQHL
jgi:hypothetical protein